MNNMIRTIKELTDKFFEFLIDDPVRPNIPHVDRIGKNRDIFVFRNEQDEVKAMTCVSYQNTIPTKESELFEKVNNPDIAVFYTIWSYAPGSGRRLIFEALNSIQKEYAWVVCYLLAGIGMSKLSKIVTITPAQAESLLNNPSEIYRKQLISGAS